MSGDSKYRNPKGELMENGNNSYVFLDESTNFNGEIEAERVILKGRVNGVVHAEREILLKKGAYIEGEIHTGNFTADNGSSCHGELHIGNQAEETSNRDNGREVSPNGQQKKQSFLLKMANLFSLT